MASRPVSKTGTRKSSEQRIGLTDRWPLLPNDVDSLVYCPPENSGAPDYAELLDEHNFKMQGARDEAAALFRAFEFGVYNDIAFRDHLLVSSTNGLILYRPVVTTGKHSSGARAEVDHWLDRWVSEPARSKPRLVAMHTFEDIDQRLSCLQRVERSMLFYIMGMDLERKLDREAAWALIRGQRPRSTQLQVITEETDDYLNKAAGIALIQCFLKWLCNVPQEGRKGATLVAANSEEELRSPDMVKLVARLLRDEADPMSTTSKNLVKYAEARGHETLTSLAQSLIRGL